MLMRLSVVQHVMMKREGKYGVGIKLNKVQNKPFDILAMAIIYTDKRLTKLRRLTSTTNNTLVALLATKHQQQTK